MAKSGITIDSYLLRPPPSALPERGDKRLSTGRAMSPPPPPPGTDSTFLLVDNDEEVDVGRSDRRRFVAGTPPEDDEVEEEEEAAGIEELFVTDVDVVDLPPPTMAPASFELDEESFISASCEDDVDEPLERRSAAAPAAEGDVCLLYTSPSPRDGLLSRMPSSA